MRFKPVLAVTAILCTAGAAGAAEDAKRTAHELKAREIYARVIAMPTSKGNAQVPAMAEYLAGEFRAAGFPAEDITIIPFQGTDDKTASLVVRYRGNGKGGKPILMLAHMDVVAAKREDWERNPFELIEENGFFWGRGTYDDKQGVVAITSTFLRLKAEGYVPSRDLIAYFSGDEETAQATTVNVAHNHRALIDAEFALNGDAGLRTLLLAYGDGARDADAFARAFGKSVDDVETSFKAFLDQRYSALSKALADPPSKVDPANLGALRLRAQEAPGNFASHSRRSPRSLSTSFAYSSAG